MENKYINFDSDINKFSNNINKLIKINDIDINLDLTEYTNIKACEMIDNWNLCLGMLGKSNLLKNKDVMKILYCLLTDSCIINNINGNILPLDLFDPILEKFLRIDICDEKNRNIELRVFTVCNTLIVIDCKDLKNYKIYELYNIHLLKEYYCKNKVNLDTILNDIKIDPKFKGSIADIEDDYKKFTITNHIKNYGEIIDKLELFLCRSVEIEKNIQKEYKKFRKLIKLK